MQEYYNEIVISSKYRMFNLKKKKKQFFNFLNECYTEGELFCKILKCSILIFLHENFCQKKSDLFSNRFQIR